MGLRHRSGLVAAMEQEQMIEDAVNAATEPVILPEAAESAESAMLETNEQVFEAGAEYDNAADAIEVTDALDQYQEVIEDLPEGQTLSTESLQMLSIGLKHCYKRLGIQETTPALESFSSPKNGTKAAMESMTENIGKVFKAIVEAIKRGLKWLADFFKGLFSSTERLKQRAEKLKELAKKSTVEKQNLPDIENDELFHKLSLNGKIDVVRDIEVMKRYSSTTLLDAYLSISSNSKEIAEGSTNGKDLTKAMENVIRSIESIGALPANIVLPGEHRLVFDAKPKLKELMQEAAHLSNSKLDIFNSNRAKGLGLVADALKLIGDSYVFEIDEKTAQKLQVLNAADIEHAMGSLVELLAEARKFEKESKAIDSNYQRIIKINSFIVDVNDKATYGTDSSTGIRRGMLKIASMNLHAGNKICGKTLQILIGYAKAMVDYSELSVKHFPELKAA